MEVVSTNQHALHVQKAPSEDPSPRTSYCKSMAANFCVDEPQQHIIPSIRRLHWEQMRLTPPPQFPVQESVFKPLQETLTGFKVSPSAALDRGDCSGEAADYSV
ncbi:hypothetical protein PBY51_005739 [Eleginops maclovinus]|uniref:Uncharacterized protein n=1 Tax=Eleginops maclovinus TaxID=56733 RepID=A0AAN7WRY7_ELEMC|nr:hypothetical protein PBY51_005739 [Eleginops maclovinus]